MATTEQTNNDRMTALADPTRSRLLLLLERHELTVGELCAYAGWAGTLGAAAPRSSFTSSTRRIYGTCSMITPSRWFAGGRNLDQFRSRMLSNRQLRYLVDYPNTQECFPEADISGGVSYFLRDQGYDGPCRISSIQNGELLDQPADRLLDEHDTLVRYNTGVDIVRKVWSDPDHVARVSETVSPIQPFSLRTNFRGEDSPDGKTHPVAVWGSQRLLTKWQPKRLRTGA
jgi:hypothetical protein